MATFILVHGSFVAAWCWRDVAARLETCGHRAVTFDLPGHGDDRTPANDVGWQDYVESLLRIARPETRPIVVGHSIGGAIGASAAEADPTAFAALVYIAGLMPASGGKLMDDVGQFDPAYLAEAVWSPDRRSVRLSLAGARDFACFYSPERAEEVVHRMAPEPIAPYEAPIVTTAARFGQVPRYYVETLRDKVVPLSMQRTIQASVGFRRVFSLDTDHAPFFSAPADLAACLDAVARGL